MLTQSRFAICAILLYIFLQMADGVNSLLVGLMGNNSTPLVLAGGNCSIQGFNHEGNDEFWTVTGDNVSSMGLVDFNSDGFLEVKTFYKIFFKNRISRLVLLANGTCCKGRPRLLFKDIIKRDLKNFNIEPSDWLNLSGDCPIWRHALYNG